MSRAFTAVLWAATGVALAFLVAPRRGDLRCASRPASSLDALGSQAARDALVVTSPRRTWRDGADPPRRHAGRVPARHPALPGPRASPSRSSSFRSCCRPPSPESASSRRSAASACSAARSTRSGSTSRSRGSRSSSRSCSSPSPFFVRTAIAAFESVDPTLPAAARTLGAGPGARVRACRAAAGRRRARRRRGALASPAASASSARRSCSRARSRASPRRSRSRSTSSSISTSTPRSRSAPFWSPIERHRAPLRQAPHVMALLGQIFTHPLRSFDAHSS